MTDPGPPEDEDGDSREPLPVGGGGTGASEERGTYPSYGLSPEDEEAFGRFYRDYLPRLTAYLVYQGAPVERAVEFVQDTMVKAYRRWQEIKSPASWAYKVAYREFLRHVMRAEEEPVDEVPDPVALLRRPEAAETWLQEQEIVQVLRELPARQRQVLALTLDGWGPAEIAKLIGIEGAAVRSNLFKARNSVARYLERREEE
ncbi:sigma-70 family RNA polymerase sigma factor [Streptomyces sp. RG80]|uniref:RNA polymerase sigma factor n=1 Tax=Streptomyces sp. RG80 TaxID=3157340 RepID=UPI003390428F